MNFIYKITKRSSTLLALLLIVLLTLCGSTYGQDNHTIAVMGAFSEELSWIKSQVEQPEEQQVMGYNLTTGTVANNDIVLALTGVGKVNAAIVTTLIIEHFQIDGIIFSGVAGGINPDLLPGDIVIGKTTIQHDLGKITPSGIDHFGVRSPFTGVRNPVFFPADSALLNLARVVANQIGLEKIQTSVGLSTPRIIVGTIATGDAFITSTPKKGELRESIKADAVEMEGAAVAQVCYQFDVPCLIIRALSDKSDENAMDDFERFYSIAAKNANRVVLEIIRNL
ncbi:5'-methylthioadenosine/S-adenosylhomocysteine nucleosidase [candidate division LCP-89 bacterium B3_LCP]|uniref:adenosylhomocysteine nucleosidase n=1 Tax=candidate division LCP-89 bacterium B3_LCP TaxID=2012998 RepID=A0A532V1H7_UNCL8|nr:MAG: 5'-methylthioadenosine/S-adenosylhomocysteine nucleosidase [candidate division LCP-89 bacterium B3_LCP]